MSGQLHKEEVNVPFPKVNTVKACNFSPNGSTVPLHPKPFKKKRHLAKAVNAT